MNFLTSAELPNMSMLKQVAEPSVAGISPVNIEMVVVLPAPF